MKWDNVYKIRIWPFYCDPPYSPTSRQLLRLDWLQCEQLATCVSPTTVIPVPCTMPDMSEALNFFLEWTYELDFPYVFILTDGPLKMLTSRPVQSKPLFKQKGELRPSVLQNWPPVTKMKNQWQIHLGHRPSNLQPRVFYHRLYTC